MEYVKLAAIFQEVEIGSLVFIEHFLDTNDYIKASKTSEFKSAVEYLNKKYGTKNTEKFLESYREKLGQ